MGPVHGFGYSLLCCRCGEQDEVLGSGQQDVGDKQGRHEKLEGWLRNQAGPSTRNTNHERLTMAVVFRLGSFTSTMFWVLLCNSVFAEESEG